MPEEGVKFEPRENILTFEEIERFVRVAVTLGVRKLRITGGEPLVRKDLAKLIRKLLAVPGIQDLALTTNGVLLAAAGPGTLRRRTAAHQHSPGYARPGTVQADHAPRRLATSPGRDRGLPPARLWSDQDQRGGGEESGGAGHRSAGALRARARHRDPLHRIHAAGCARDLWVRDKVLTTDDDDRDAPARDRPAGRDPGPRSARSRDRIPIHRRHRARGLHRVGEQAVLPELQPHPPDRRRQGPLLPVRDRGDRRARRCCATDSPDSRPSPKPCGAA